MGSTCSQLWPLAGPSAHHKHELGGCWHGGHCPTFACPNVTCRSSHCSSGRQKAGQGRAGQGKHLGEQTWLNAAVSLLWDGDAAQQFLAYVARENITFQAWGTQVFCYRILQFNTWPADLDLVHGLLLLLFKYESNNGFSFPRVYHKTNCRVRAI